MADGEQIKVTLTADSSQLTREFQKAEERAKSFATKTLPLTTAEMTRLYVQGEKVRKGLKEQQTVVRGSGQGFLQLAQFADDAQYGMRGILNNIPGLVMGFGGGAGLAGAISIAVLALYGLRKGLEAVTGVGNINKFDEAFAAAAKQGQEITAQAQEQTRVRRDQERLQKRIADETKRELDFLKDALGVSRDRWKLEESQDQARERGRRNADEIRAARAGIDDTPVLGEAQARREGLEERQRQAREDLAEAQARLNAESADYNRILRNTGDATSRYQNYLANINDELETLIDRNNRTKGELATVQEGLKNAPSGRGVAGLRANEEKNLGIISAREKAESDRIRDLQAQQEKVRGILKDIEDLGKDGLQTSSARSEELRKQQAILRESLGQTSELMRIEQERQMAEARRRGEEQQRTQDESRRQGEAQKSAAEEVDPETLKERAALRQRLAEDLAVLKLRAAGHKEFAQALERENTLQRESRELAKSLGIPQKQALEFVRARARLQQQAEEREAGGERGSRIRRSANDRLGMGGGSRLGSSGGLQGPRGLERSARRAFDRERATPDRSVERAASNYYERSLEKFSSIDESLKKLGLV